MCHPGNCHSTWNGNRIAKRSVSNQIWMPVFYAIIYPPPPPFPNGTFSSVAYYVYTENLSRDQPFLFYYTGQRISKFEAFIGPT